MNCKDCKGTRVYVGLDESRSEPWRTCAVSAIKDGRWTRDVKAGETVSVDLSVLGDLPLRIPTTV